MRSLATRRLRAGARYELLAYDALDAADQARVAGLAAADDFYGVLVPRDGLAPPKAVSKEAALLFLTLQRPQAVPSLLRTMLDGDLDTLRRLVLDGVLEIEQGGVFVSGPSALALFPGAERDGPSHPLARLAYAAIGCAAACGDLDAGALAQRIYEYGRLPCTSMLRRRFAADADLLAFLTAEGDAAARLRSWTLAPPTGRASWLQWSTPNARGRPTHKLYVSARIDAMPRVFALSLDVLGRCGCGTFKIGRAAEGLCRPDKLVAYFASLEELHACATLLEGALTAPIDGAGYLSWGMDPPDLASSAATGQRESWRYWLASRVAAAVLSGKHEGDVVPFVLRRLELDGVDPATWTPTQALWRAHAARAEDVA
jgi:hypothetical protein